MLTGERIKGNTLVGLSQSGPRAKTQVGQEKIEATIEDPIARIRVYVKIDENFEESDRVVAFPLSRLSKASKPERQVQNPAIKKALENKLEEHREKVGDDPRKRTTLRTLEIVFERGVAAYKTNPSSVRPNIGNAESWAYSRVNSFLYVLRNLRFRGGKHDTDLLPEAHPLSSKGKMTDLENNVRHVIGVEETPDSVIIEYAKAHDEEMDMEENAHYDEDEEEDRGIDATFYRSVRLRKDDKDKTRFNVAFVSEEPVLREFGYEIIDQERMDTSFLEKWSRSRAFHARCGASFGSCGKR